MKKRNLAAVFGLSLITLGIYDLYWLVQTKKELNKKTKIHTPTIWLLFLPAILLLIVVVIAIATGSNNTTNLGPQSSASTSSANVVGILAGLVAIVIILPVTFYWFFKFSKAINEYTSGKMSTGVTFLLLYILHLIGVVLVQDTFNDMIEAGSLPGSMDPAPAAPGPMAQPNYGPPPTPPTIQMPPTEPYSSVTPQEAQFSPNPSQVTSPSTAPTQPIQFTPAVTTQPQITTPSSNPAQPINDVAPVQPADQVIVSPTTNDDDQRPLVQ